MTAQRGQVIRVDSGWSVRWYDATGRRRQRGVFRTKTEASTVLNDELAKVRLGALYKPDLTLNELVAAFLEQYDGADRSVETLRYFLRFSQERFGQMRIATIHGHDVAAWRKTLRSEHEKHHAMRALRQVLEAARRWGWVEKNAAKDERNPQPRSTNQRPFGGWDEIDALTENLKPRDRTIIVVAVGTGLRPEEYLALHQSDVDLEKRTVTVHRKFANGKLDTYAKTNRSRRTVPLRSRVVEALSDYASPGRELFPQRGGGYLDLRSWRRNVWNDAFDLTDGLEQRGPYQMRHTYASWSIAAGVDLFTLSRRMGTSLAMIDRTYGHLMVDADDRERTILDTWDEG